MTTSTIGIIGNQSGTEVRREATWSECARALGSRLNYRLVEGLDREGRYTPGFVGGFIHLDRAAWRALAADIGVEVDSIGHPVSEAGWGLLAEECLRRSGDLNPERIRGGIWI